MKGDLSPFKRAIARDKSEVTACTVTINDINTPGDLTRLKPARGIGRARRQGMIKARTAR